MNLTRGHLELEPAQNVLKGRGKVLTETISPWGKISRKGDAAAGCLRIGLIDPLSSENDGPLASHWFKSKNVLADTFGIKAGSEGPPPRTGRELRNETQLAGENPARVKIERRHRGAGPSAAYPG